MTHSRSVDSEALTKWAFYSENRGAQPGHETRPRDRQEDGLVVRRVKRRAQSGRGFEARYPARRGCLLAQGRGTSGAPQEGGDFSRAVGGGVVSPFSRWQRPTTRGGTEQKLQDNEVVTYHVVDVVGDGSMA